MTIPTLISSLLLYVLADYYQDAYNYTGKIKYSERYKLCFIGCVLSAIMIPPEPILLLVWILWHYPTQQIGQGWLRHGKPLYLGVGKFDQMIVSVTAWIIDRFRNVPILTRIYPVHIYVFSLVSSLILGIWLYLL